MNIILDYILNNKKVIKSFDNIDEVVEHLEKITEIETFNISSSDRITSSDVIKLAKRDNSRTTYINKIINICEELSAGGERSQEDLLTWINERDFDSSLECFTEKDFEGLSNEQIKEFLEELETIKENTVFDYDEE